MLFRSYHDIQDWYEIFNTDFQPDITDEDKEFLKIAAEILPNEVTVGNFSAWITEITKTTGRKGKDLYHPLRVALTNKTAGPELSKIVPLLGPGKVKQRLLGST